MKELPTDDPLFGKGPLRADGRRLIPAYLFEVKKPDESKDRGTITSWCPRSRRKMRPSRSKPATAAGEEVRADRRFARDRLKSVKPRMRPDASGVLLSGAPAPRKRSAARNPYFVSALSTSPNCSHELPVQRCSCSWV